MTPPKCPYVYALVDQTGAVFYVGKGNGRRMFQHVTNARRGVSGPRHDRIREILAAGGEIRYEVLGQYDTDEEAGQAEVLFIAAHSGLTNLTKGGEIGARSSDYFRQRMREQAEDLLLRLEANGHADHPLTELVRQQASDPTPNIVEICPKNGLRLSWGPGVGPVPPHWSAP